MSKKIRKTTLSSFDNEIYSQINMVLKHISIIKGSKYFIDVNGKSILIEKQEADQLAILKRLEAEVYIQMGLLQREISDYSQALVHWEHAIALNPKNILVLTYKAELLFDLKSYKEAVEAFDKALSVDPSIITSHSNKGVALCFLQDYSGALAAFDKAIKLAPFNQKLYQNKSYTLVKLGRNEEAVECLNFTIKLKSNSAPQVSFVEVPFQLRKVKHLESDYKLLKRLKSEAKDFEFKEVKVQKSKRQKLDEQSSEQPQLEYPQLEQKNLSFLLLDEDVTNKDSINKNLTLSGENADDIGWIDSCLKG